ncbi:unnamed protein product [Danaus chrysippus]|uniref:(African queen) hypothetical protein n=1 Tax=Danaus chrysippus TaxID=151541 RepID=A0A8J2QHS0_9NEOP|nr:unnamed protein product [Danaus chrysippus]
MAPGVETCVNIIATTRTETLSAPWDRFGTETIYNVQCAPSARDNGSAEPRTRPTTCILTLDRESKTKSRSNYKAPTNEEARRLLYSFKEKL